LIKEEGGIRVEESKQIAEDWNCIVIRNNGKKIYLNILNIKNTQKVALQVQYFLI